MSAGSGDMRRSREAEIRVEERVEDTREGSRGCEGKCDSVKVYRERYRRVSCYEDVRSE
jgi:hypothetical protein